MAQNTTTFSPLDPARRTLAWQVGAVLAGSLILTLSSQVAVPMYPVPMTLQTLAVTLIGALYGMRLGTATLVAWLIEGALGLPVFANGGAGIAHLIGPTGGYLFGFVAVAALAGYLAERGWNGRRPMLAFANLLIGNALCLGLGALWLAAIVGMSKAVALGVTPFVLGGVLKAALGALALGGMRR
jgi:biotin transport system substrate-specific component